MLLTKPLYQLNLWVLKVHDSEMLHLVDGIGQIRSSQDKNEEREVKEETEGVHQDSSTYSMRGRHESNISRGNAERETAREREVETLERHTAPVPVDGEERDEYLHASSREHQQVDLELLD